jgi:hypothetical protein
VSVAIHHSQKPAPRTYGLSVLAGHDAGNLVEVVQIVRRPRGQVLAQGRNSEGGVETPLVEIARLQIHRLQLA